MNKSRAWNYIYNDNKRRVAKCFHWGWLKWIFHFGTFYIVNTSLVRLKRKNVPGEWNTARADFKHGMMSVIKLVGMYILLPMLLFSSPFILVNVLVNVGSGLSTGMSGVGWGGGTWAKCTQCQRISVNQWTGFHSDLLHCEDSNVAIFVCWKTTTNEENGKSKCSSETKTVYWVLRQKSANIRFTIRGGYWFIHRKSCVWGEEMSERK